MWYKQPYFNNEKSIDTPAEPCLPAAAHIAGFPVPEQMIVC